MDREVIFRGKRLDNDEWAYGDLMHDNRGGCYIYPLDAENLYTENKVDPDTVGGFTGMTDKKGAKIFEGDIADVFTSVVASKYRGVVKMYRGSWRVEYEGYGTGTVFHPMLFFDELADKNTEVIGNIYDNKELLNKK